MGCLRFPQNGKENSVNLNGSFVGQRRQHYINRICYENTLKRLEQDNILLLKKAQDHATNSFAASTALGAIASNIWFAFQLKFTAGAGLESLAFELPIVVDAYERYVEEVEKLSDEEYFPPFPMEEIVDEYVDYLNLICFSILLHREDLLPRIHGLVKDTDYDGSDAVIEELLKFFLPDRPELDRWNWDMPYKLLLDSIDNPDANGRAQEMKEYVRSWYRGMRGKAHFWGKHEQIKDAFSPYSGYWATCAAAFTYLYDIDDKLYREELVYPKDLVDFARSMPRGIVTDQDGSMILRVLGGQKCPRDGMWFSPARVNSKKYFKKNDEMPIYFEADYGETIWQWVSD